MGTTPAGNYGRDVAGNLNVGGTYYAGGTPGLSAANVSGLTFTSGLYTSGSISGFVTSSATTGYIPKMTSASALENSLFYETGGKVGLGTTLPSQLFQVNASGSSAVVITSGGNLGIGTTSPTQKLDVRGAIAAGTNGTEFTVSTAGAITAPTSTNTIY